ncbi:MAG TPA: hypothetical protein VMS77_06885 [Conexivisphaerales archaeon]|nr:hypothetical protein [Conexivisphaerales archaeon]
MGLRAGAFYGAVLGLLLTVMLEGINQYSDFANVTYGLSNGLLETILLVVPICLIGLTAVIVYRHVNRHDLFSPTLDGAVVGLAIVFSLISLMWYPELTTRIGHVVH